MASYGYNHYEPTQVFYRKNISTKKFEEVALIPYEQNTYYYK
jgi:hypothetical protein